MRKKLLILATTAVLIIAVLLWVLSRQTPLTIVTTNQPQNELPVSVPVQRVPVPKPALAELVEVTYSTPLEHDQMVISVSLEGTHIDGALQADAAGNLILNIGIRDFFDYFLSTSDEVGPEAAINEIARYIQQYLPERAQQQARQLLESYLRYKEYEFGIQQTPVSEQNMTNADTISLLRSSFEKLRTHRLSLFEPAADQALFGLEDTYANYTLATLTVMGDELLNEQEKIAKVEQLQKTLPAELAATEQQQRQGRLEQQALTQALSSNQGDSEIYDLLGDKGYSQDQADQIVAHRQQQREFDQRYQAYASARAQLLTDSGDQNAALETLKTKFFITPEEQTQASLRDLRLD